MGFAPVANVVPTRRREKLRLLAVNRHVALGVSRPACRPSPRAACGVRRHHLVRGIRPGARPAGSSRPQRGAGKISRSPKLRDTHRPRIDAAASASPAEARAYRDAEVERWGKLVRALGVKAE